MNTGWLMATYPRMTDIQSDYEVTWTYERMIDKTAPYLISAYDVPAIYITALAGVYYLYKTTYSTRWHLNPLFPITLWLN